MVIGRIDWFGGQNNKTQTINDFGFIIPIDGANTKGIYVHRDDVPIDLQDIIEGKRGKGVYVQFEIDTNCKRAINIKLTFRVRDDTDNNFSLLRWTASMLYRSKTATQSRERFISIKIFMRL